MAGVSASQAQFTDWHTAQVEKGGFPSLASSSSPSLLPSSLPASFLLLLLLFSKISFSSKGLTEWRVSLLSPHFLMRHNWERYAYLIIIDIVLLCCYAVVLVYVDMPEVYIYVTARK